MCVTYSLCVGMEDPHQDEDSVVHSLRLLCDTVAAVSGSVQLMNETLETSVLPTHGTLQRLSANLERISSASREWHPTQR